MRLKIFRKIAENGENVKRYIKYVNSKICRAKTCVMVTIQSALWFVNASTSLSFCMDIQQIYGHWIWLRIHNSWVREPTNNGLLAMEQGHIWVKLITVISQLLFEIVGWMNFCLLLKESQNCNEIRFKWADITTDAF